MRQRSGMMRRFDGAVQEFFVLRPYRIHEIFVVVAAALRAGPGVRSRPK